MNAFSTTEVSPPPEPIFFETRALLRRAAEAGPGYRGRREDAGSIDRAALAAALEAQGETPPAYLGSSPRWIDRRAKLFEAGEYPDKGVSITREDLASLCAAFDLPVPILIEHAKSPLEIGFLTQVEAVGDELFGNLALTEEADALIRTSGARSLSLGLSRDLARIQEVSLVTSPRVASAQMFGGEIRFWARLEPIVETNGTEETHGSPAADPSSSFQGDFDWRARFHALSARVERDMAEQKLEAWVREGRILPSQVPFARALMAIPETIDFDGESRPVHQLLIAMLERQPPHGLFSETAPTLSPSSASLFLPEEAEFYRRHFPDVSLDVIAARKFGVR